jgi:integrase
MIMFMFDSGIRSPTELMNVRVCDLEWDDKQSHYTLDIREETSKTFGRKIKLLLCSDLVKEYIAKTPLSSKDYLFRKTPQRVNQYIKNLGYKILKIGTVEERVFKERKYQVITDGLSMYDFRHSSACYWLPRYKSENALKYRFGWKKSDMIHYYTELLGMRDTIHDDDLYTDITKTELENQIIEKGKEMQIMQERMQEQDKKMKEILDIMKALQLEKLKNETIVLQNPT